MIGVFDSGVGGLSSYRELKRLLPSEDLIYLADRRNAPYGTKDRDTVLKYTRNNIKALRKRGAEHILIACCTASSVFPLLEPEERRQVTPIILPAADAALTHGKRVAVIATEQTVSSHAFREAALAKNPDAKVFELPTQILVSLVELGARDGELLPREGDLLDKIAGELWTYKPDSLILGCTHFSSLGKELEARLPGVAIIDAAVIGARALVAEISDTSTGGKGITTYTEGIKTYKN